MEEAKHFVKTSELFQKEHIDQVQVNWLSNDNSAALSAHDWEQFVNSGTSSNQTDVLHPRDEPIEPENNTERLLQGNPVQILKTVNVMMMMNGGK